MTRKTYTVIMFANDGLGVYVQTVKAKTFDEAAVYGCSQAGILGDVYEDQKKDDDGALRAVVIEGDLQRQHPRPFATYENNLPELEPQPLFRTGQRASYGPSYLNGDRVAAEVIGPVKDPPFADVPLWRVRLINGARAWEDIAAIPPGGETNALEKDLQPL